jgi:hypothetical protein
VTDNLTVTFQNQIIQIGLLGVPKRVWGLCNRAVLIVECEGVGGRDRLIVVPHLNVVGVTVVSRKQVNVAEDAVIAEEILILKIASRAPFIHLADKLVFALAECQGKFGGAMRYCGVANVFAIEEKLNAGRNALENYIVFALCHLGCYGYEPSVYAEGVIVGNV